MGFTRFVEVGRVVLINYGPNAGKLATVVDFVDSKRVLVDGPQSLTGVHRQVIALKRLSLTDVVVTGLKRDPSEKELKAAWMEQDALSQWEKTSWAKRLISKRRRADLTDFDRFKVMKAKQAKSKIIAAKVASLSK